MKYKRNLIIFLSFTVFAIWGAIVIRIINNGNYPVESEINQSEKFDFIMETLDTMNYSLTVYKYEDPFLKNEPNYTRKKRNESEVKKKPKSTLVPLKNINETPIIYKGYIVFSGSKKAQAIIAVNGENDHFAIGDVIFEGMSLRKIYKDSIQVYRKGKLLYIKKTM